MDIIKVKAVSRTAAVAGAIAGVMRDEKHAEVQAIGAGAVNQAVKAMVLAKNFLEQDGIDVVFVPEFVNVEIDGKVRTAIKFVVDPKIDCSHARRLSRGGVARSILQAGISLRLCPRSFLPLSDESGPCVWAWIQNPRLSVGMVSTGHKEKLDIHVS